MAASTRDTLGDVETFKRLISGTLTGEFVENEAIELGAQGLSFLPVDGVTMPNIAKFTGGIHDLDIEALELSAKITDVGSSGIVRNCDNLRSIIIRRSPTGAIDDEDLPNSILCGEGAVYTDWGYVDEWESSLNGRLPGRRFDWSYVNVYPLERYPVTDFSSIDDTWADIVAASNAGTYRDRYAIGDTKRMDLLDGKHVYMQLVAFDTDVLASDTTQTVPMTWLLRGVMPYRHVMSASTGDVTWETSDLRSWMNDDLLSLMPSIVRRNIKTVRKGFFNDYPTMSATSEGFPAQDPPLSYSNDGVWAPSMYEMNPSHQVTDGVNRLSTGFTYYTGIATGIVNYYWRARYGDTFQGERYWSRDRSAFSASYGKHFYDLGIVTTSWSIGSPSYRLCTAELPIMFGFCI